MTALGSSAFYQTPMEYSGYTGSYGSIYVPELLYDQFVADSMWASVADRIVPAT